MGYVAKKDTKGLQMRKHVPVPTNIGLSTELTKRRRPARLNKPHVVVFGGPLRYFGLVYAVQRWVSNYV